MTEVLDTVRATLEKRLKELDAEANRIRGALAGLAGGQRRRGRPSSTRKASSTPRKTTRRSEQGRDGRKLGKRQEQFLRAVRKSPGAGVSQISRQIGIRPQQGYAIARSLRDRGRIAKRGKGYAVKS